MHGIWMEYAWNENGISDHSIPHSSPNRPRLSWYLKCTRVPK